MLPPPTVDLASDLEADMMLQQVSRDLTVATTDATDAQAGAHSAGCEHQEMSAQSDSLAREYFPPFTEVLARLLARYMSGHS